MDLLELVKHFSQAKCLIYLPPVVIPKFVEFGGKSYTNL